MKLVPAFGVAALCCAAAWGQSASLTADVSTYGTGGGQVVLTATIAYSSVRDFVGGVSVTNGGVGYTSAPSVALSGGGGAGATAAVITISGGSVKDIRVENGGSGYTSAPTVSLTGGGGSGSVAVAQLATVTALGYTISLPPGWTLAALGGPNVPNISSPVGSNGTLEFSYTSVPTNGAKFTVTLSYPAGLAGMQSITASALLRPPTTEIAIAPIALAQAGTNPPPITAPAITSQPTSMTVTAGQGTIFSVGAAGSAPLSYQWRKDGADIVGATNAALTLSNVTLAAAGAYRVVVSNAVGNAASNVATLTVNSPPTIMAPQIVTQPLPQDMNVGGNVTFTVSAVGTAPLAYQWRKDGANLTSATSASLVLNNVTIEMAGSYSVAVSNSAGSVLSAPVVLTITPASAPSIAGAYFGTLGGNAGKFACLLRADGSGAFIANTAELSLLARDVKLESDGRFRFAATPLNSVVRSAPTAAGEPEYVVEGVVLATGLTGSISGLGATLTAAAAGNAADAVAGLEGFYQAGVLGKSAAAYVIVGAAGDVFLITISDGLADSGRGRVDASGALQVQTDRNARIAGAIAANMGTLTLTQTPARGAPVTFLGGNTVGRSQIEKLINISTRSTVSSTAGGLITGFVINGDAAKSVLVRAIGPTLASFGVDGALPAAHLEVFKGSLPVAAGGDWGRSPDSVAVAAAASRVGAFALAGDSRDAARLLTLAPGAYTVMVTGQDGASGVSLVEVYDASESGARPSQRIINLSTRATTGAGDQVLIAGFVINGAVPKRVLVRGVGPGLANLGVSGALARPRVAIFAGDSLVAENAGWSASIDAELIARASREASAFPLSADAADAALVVHLSPGAYTAQLGGIGAATGVALVEIYELP